MSDLKMNTESVNVVADNINVINNQIRDDISNVDSAISSLNGSWEGSASSCVIDKYYSLKNQFCDNRYTVLNNYVNYLKQQIGTGYESTETTNTTLADQFK